jgi:sucrose phosphorylase
MELLARTKIGRDINRRYFSATDVDAALDKPVVQALFKLIRFRNEHSAFNGVFSIQDTPDRILGLRWDNQDSWAQLDIDFQNADYEISHSD